MHPANAQRREPARIPMGNPRPAASHASDGKPATSFLGTSPRMDAPCSKRQGSWHIGRGARTVNQRADRWHGDVPRNFRRSAGPASEVSIVLCLTGNMELALQKFLSIVSDIHLNGEIGSTHPGWKNSTGSNSQFTRRYCHDPCIQTFARRRHGTFRRPCARFNFRFRAGNSSARFARKHNCSGDCVARAAGDRAGRTDGHFAANATNDQRANDRPSGGYCACDYVGSRT